MKTKLILLFAIVALWQPVFCNEQAKDNKTQTPDNSNKIGYYVYVQKCNEVAELKTESLHEVENFIHSFYPEFCENLEYQFQFTHYYRVNCFKKEIYCEKMRINKRGVYKRLKTFNL